jgi:hypothetical protein
MGGIKGSTANSIVWNTAVRLGNIEIMEWLYESHAVRRIFDCFHSIAWHAAGSTGNLDALQWMHDHVQFQYQRDMSHACTSAIDRGHLHVLEWAKKNMVSNGSISCVAQELPGRGSFPS